jgi:hypothetical protein
LADAITQIAGNTKGIELRTVQFWFQDNDKGISPENVRWLARVFGCDDPDATIAWQKELGAARMRLASRRRRKDGVADVSACGDAPDFDLPRPTPHARPSLARRSEAVFGRGALLNLPAAIFAGAVALNFVAYLIGLDSITYVRGDGVTKQVGFHWAPNWTLLFLVFLPMFFFFAVDLLAFWKTRGRSVVLASTGRSQVKRTWRSKVDRSSATYWAVFLICFLFAGLLQWTSLRLIPLMRGVDSDDIDWGSVALVRPDVISTTEAIAFTGFAYLYMSVSFYLMVGGLILLWTLVQDFWEMTRGAGADAPPAPADVDAVGLRVMRGLFRCSAAGLLVAICMKTQSLFLPTDAETVWSWLFSDAGFVSTERASSEANGLTMHWTSLLIVLPVCFVFFYAIIRIGLHGPLLAPLARMLAAFALIGAAYLLIGAFPGFALLLGVATLVAIYGFFDPSFDGGQQRAMEDSRDVS